MLEYYALDDPLPVPVSSESVLLDEVFGEPLERVELVKGILTLPQDLLGVFFECHGSPQSDVLFALLDWPDFGANGLGHQEKVNYFARFEFEEPVGWVGYEHFELYIDDYAH